MASRNSAVSGKVGRSFGIWSFGAAVLAALAIWWPWVDDVNGNNDHRVTFLDQGWSPELRERFYYTPQGSRLMPYKWFLAIEQVDRTERFSAPGNLEAYGYLLPVNGRSPRNPDGLPVGFARGTFDEPGLGRWLGLTCAACHTNDVSYQGRTIRIDGAPALADFGSFLSDLAAAVAATRLDKEKFGRFAASVLGPAPEPAEAQQLFQAFSLYAVTMEGQTWMRGPPLPAGPGRTDALGQIINALAVFDLREPDNLRPTTAPVSYPFLWYTPRLEWVQWVPIANNPIMRNGGEALGVFGRANLTGSPEELFTSSAIFENLYALEQWVDDLKPPPWPEKVFGAVDTELAAKGAALFQENCVGCHNMPPFKMSKPGKYIDREKQFIKITAVNFKKVGTDPQYTLDLITRTTKTNDLKDILFGVPPEKPLKCGPITEKPGRPVVAGGEYFTATVGAIIRRGFCDLELSLEEILAYSDYRFHPMAEGDRAPKPYLPSKNQVFRLKAGPLLGIWATGPFLHNGSVPNIYELLSPPEERSSVFWVGNRELDLEKLGYVSAEAPGLFRFDTSLRGNGNGGHTYAHKRPNKDPFTHEDRMAVIEFLKDPTPLPRKKKSE